MSLRSQSAEINRLLSAFEAEAAKFHDIRLTTILLTQKYSISDRKFALPNHSVMLWQYYGSLRSDRDTQLLLNDLQTSDLQW